MYFSDQISRSLICHIGSSLISICLCSFVIGNLLIPDLPVLAQSVIALTGALIILFAFFFVVWASKSLAFGVVSIFGVFWVSITQNWSWPLYLYCFLALPGSVVYFHTTKLSWERGIFQLIVGLVGAVTIHGARRIQTGFNQESLVNDGLSHADTLFHASIAAMLKSYAIVSTGINGLVETPYHALSHAAIAGFSELFGLGVLACYGFVPMLLFAPLLIIAMAVSPLALAPIDRDHIEWPQIARMAITGCALLSILPVVFWTQGLRSSYLVSESYIVSLVLILAIYPVLVARQLSIADSFVIVVGGLLLMCPHQVVQVNC
jgi:hypothetical protein